MAKSKVDPKFAKTVLKDLKAANKALKSGGSPIGSGDRRLPSYDPIDNFNVKDTHLGKVSPKFAGKILKQTNANPVETRNHLADLEVHRRVADYLAKQEKKPKDRNFFQEKVADVGDEINKGFDFVGNSGFNGVKVKDIAGAVGDGAGWAFDKISRPLYGVANATKYGFRPDEKTGKTLTYGNNGFTDPSNRFVNILTGNALPNMNSNPKGFGSAFKKGFMGEEKTTFSDVIKQTADTDTRENAFDNKTYRALAGVAGDIALDPLTYVGVGPVTKAAKGTKKLATLSKADPEKAKALEETSTRLKEMGLKRSDFSDSPVGGRLKAFEGLMDETDYKDLLGGNTPRSFRKIGDRRQELAKVTENIAEIEKKLDQAPLISPAKLEEFKQRKLELQDIQDQITKVGSKAYIRDFGNKLKQSYGSKADETGKDAFIDSLVRQGGGSEDEIRHVIDTDRIKSAIKDHDTRSYRSSEFGEASYSEYKFQQKAKQANAIREGAPVPPVLSKSDWIKQGTKGTDEHLGEAWIKHPNLSDDQRTTLFDDVHNDMFKNDKEYRGLSQSIAKNNKRRNEIRAEITDLNRLSAARKAKDSTELAPGEQTLEQRIKSLKDEENTLKRDRLAQVEKRTDLKAAGVNQAANRLAKQNKIAKETGKKDLPYSDPEQAEHLKTLRAEAQKRLDSDDTRVVDGDTGIRNDDPRPDNYEVNEYGDAQSTKIKDSKELDLGVAGDDIEEILRTGNMERIVAATNRELRNLESPVGKLERVLQDIPTSIANADGTLSRSKLLGTLIDFVDDSNRMIVRTSAINKLDDADEVKTIAKEIVDRANAAGSGFSVQARKNEILGALEDVLESAHHLTTPVDNPITWTQKTVKESAEVIRKKNAAEYRSELKALQGQGAEASVIKTLKEKHAVKQAQLNEAVRQAEESRTAVKKLMSDTALIEVIAKSPILKDNVGLALKTWGNTEVFRIPGTTAIHRAAMFANDTKMMNKISDVYYNSMKKATGSGTLFRSSANMEMESQLARARAVSQTSVINALHINKLNDTIAKWPIKERKTRMGLYLRGMRSGDDELLTYIDEQFTDMLPYLNGSVMVGDSPLNISEIGKFLPKAFSISQKHQEATSRIFTGNDIASILGTGRNANDKRAMDPLDAIWHTRIAIEQAMAFKTLKHTLNESFGIKDAAGALGKRSAAHESIQDLEKSGWKKIAVMGDSVYDPKTGKVQEVATHWFPPEVHRDIDRLVTMLEPRNVMALNHGLDKITGYWKMLATIYNPGYYSRNMIGEVMSGWLGGVSNPKHYRSSARVIKYMRGEGSELAALRQHSAWEHHVADGVPDGTKIIGTTRKGEKITEQDIAVLYQDTGLKTGFIDTTFNDTTHNKVNLRSNPLTRTAAKGHEKVQKAGELGEDFPRIAHFIHSMQHAPKHMDKQQAAIYAAEQVRKYHFDYSDVTKFEQNIMLRAFPFYKWTRKAMPLMVSMLFQQPGKVNAYSKTMSAVSNATNPDVGTDEYIENNSGFMPNYTGVVPGWLRDAQAYPLGKDSEDKQTFMGIATPQQDALKALFNPAQTAQLMQNPLLKGLTAGATGDEDYKLTDNLPQTKFLDKVLNRKDSALQEDNAPMDETAASFATGLGIYENPGFDDANKLTQIDPEKFRVDKDGYPVNGPMAELLKRNPDFYLNQWKFKNPEEARRIDAINEFKRPNGTINWRAFNAKYPEYRKF